jgi:hypothetical protein
MITIKDDSKQTTKKAPSQCDKILNYLQQGGRLTVLKALDLGFGINLRSRISEIKSKLKDKGTVDKLQSKYIYVDGTRYKEYWWGEPEADEKGE